MDPTSGPPRSAAQQPSTTEDPHLAPIAADAPIARFEFSDAGTKVLMVEWSPVAPETPEDSESSEAAAPNIDSAPAPDPVPSIHTDTPNTAADAGADADTSRASALHTAASNWEVSWPGKKTVLHASESDADATDKHTLRRRVFFLLPQGASVPATITLSPPAGDSRPGIALKPLPAIFPPGFDAEAGARGVLHTIWARRRLAALDREMAEEMRTNAESVGVEMALAEKQWIQNNFLKAPQAHFPASTRSNVSGRLGDKLRGLKLATSPADLVPGSSANTFTTGSQSNTLSPQGNDIAFSSFSAMNTTAPAGPISLNAALHGNFAAAASAPVRMGSQDTDDELFALPLSPRSPDMKKSPFSAL